RRRLLAQPYHTTVACRTPRAEWADQELRPAGELEFPWQIETPQRYPLLHEPSEVPFPAAPELRPFSFPFKVLFEEVFERSLLIVGGSLLFLGQFDLAKHALQTLLVLIILKAVDEVVHVLVVPLHHVA